MSSKAARSAYKVFSTLVRRPVFTTTPCRTYSQLTAKMNRPLATGVSQFAQCYRSTAKLHTQGDQELASFLTDEIQEEEKGTKGPLPASILDFKVTKTDGADIEFTKSTSDETIKVVLNVNNSVDDESNMEEFNEQTAQSSQEELPAPDMVSRPSFTVEITKADKTLVIACSFPSQGAEDPPPEAAGEEDQYYDVIEIVEAVLLNKGADWSESTYSIGGSVMDSTLYSLLLNMLEERGVSADFIDSLVEYSTRYEQELYLGFLRGLKGFVSK